MFMNAKKTLSLPDVLITSVQIKIEGVSPLIVHKFSEKSIRQIEDKQQKKAKAGREVRNPQQEAKDATYYFIDGKRTGFPAGGIKAAIIRGAKNVGLVMKDTQTSFFIEPDEMETNLVEIIGTPEMRTDMVRIGMGTADVRYRPCYYDWGMNLRITYIETQISDEQIYNAVRAAGFGVGIGEWRPEKKASGTYGRFKIVTD